MWKLQNVDYVSAIQTLPASNNECLSFSLAVCRLDGQRPGDVIWACRETCKLVRVLMYKHDLPSIYNAFLGIHHYIWGFSARRIQWALKQTFSLSWFFFFFSIDLTFSCIVMANPRGNSVKSFFKNNYFFPFFIESVFSSNK